MEDLKFTVAKNIAELRKKNKLTQAELAEKLNYSDKAISKWERGESLPDISILKSVAGLFNVSVDYLLTDDHSDYHIEMTKKSSVSKKNRRIISLLASSLVWLVATVCFAFLLQVLPGFGFPWMTFVYSVPCAFTVHLVFQAIWGTKASLIYVFVSIIVWSSLACVYLSLLLFAEINFWALFVIGVPAQIIIILWSGLSFRKKGDKNA